MKVTATIAVQEMDGQEVTGMSIDITTVPGFGKRARIRIGKTDVIVSAAELYRAAHMVMAAGSEAKI